MPPPKELHFQATHTMPPQKIEIFKSLEDWVEKDILIHLKPVEKCWQPKDFLPDPTSEGFDEQVKELRERAKELPDEYFVVLVGDMITEEALPTYQTMLNTLDGTRDETGASPSPWAVWTRAWTAEENRHTDLLNKYLYLCGRVDMRQIEKTIQYLIGSGMVRYLLPNLLTSHSLILKPLMHLTCTTLWNPLQFIEGLHIAISKAQLIISVSFSLLVLFLCVWRAEKTHAHSSIKSCMPSFLFLFIF